MDGILLVDKPEGWTSHDVVAKVRGVLRQINNGTRPAHGGAMQGAGEQRTEVCSEYSEGVTQPATKQSAPSSNSATGSAGRQVEAVSRIKVGHTGTLDPMASGLLILVIGKFTKRAAEFSKLDKVYKAEITLGAVSTTGDREGALTKKSSHQPVPDEIQQALNKFLGTISQTPPAFSAVKVDGQRAYKAARTGRSIKIEPRQVTIYKITEVGYSYPTLKFTTAVSSGTYIRSLAEDIGGALGTGGYLSALRRTQVGQFEVENALRIENLSLKDIQKSLAPH